MKRALCNKGSVNTIIHCIILQYVRATKKLNQVQNTFKSKLNTMWLNCITVNVKRTLCDKGFINISIYRERRILKIKEPQDFWAAVCAILHMGVGWSKNIFLLVATIDREDGKRKYQWKGWTGQWPTAEPSRARFRSINGTKRICANRRRPVGSSRNGSIYRRWRRPRVQRPN